MSYSCWLLSGKDRSTLLAAFPPKFPDVIAHHVTITQGKFKNLSMPPEAVMEVIGYATDGIGLEALVVRVNGSSKRDDGRVYHITWSIDRVAGYKPADSNGVIEAYGWEDVVPEIKVIGIPDITK